MLSEHFALNVYVIACFFKYTPGDKDKELVDTVPVLCVLIPQPVNSVSASDRKLSSSTLHRPSGHIAPRSFRFSVALGFPRVNLDLRLWSGSILISSIPSSSSRTHPTAVFLCGDPPHTHQLLSEAGCLCEL